MERQRREDEMKNRPSKKGQEAEQSMTNRASSPQTKSEQAGGKSTKEKSSQQDKDTKEEPNLQVAGPAGEITAGPRILPAWPCLVPSKKMEQATSISSCSRDPGRAPEETGMEQVMSELQALKGLHGLLHRGNQANENLDEASRALLMRMLDNATEQALLRQAKMLSHPVMSPALERNLSIQPGRRENGDAEGRLMPIASPSLSLHASEMSRRLKPQSSVRSRAGRLVYDDHRRRERDDRLLARVDSNRSSRTAMAQLPYDDHRRRERDDHLLARVDSNRSSRTAVPRLPYDDHLRRERDERLLARVNSNRSSRTAVSRLLYDDHLRHERDDRLLARVNSNRSSRTAVPRLHPSTPEQRLARLDSRCLSVVAKPQRGMANRGVPRADCSNRLSRMRGGSGRSDRSSSSSPERSSSRRCSVARAPSSHGHATVRGVEGYGSSTHRHIGRLNSGLSMDVRSRRGSERAGRGAATPRRSSSSNDGNAITIRRSIGPNREPTERYIRRAEETGEGSLLRQRRKDGAPGGSVSMGWSSRRSRRALERIDSVITYSSGSSSPSCSMSPTAPSMSDPSASCCSSSVPVSRRGGALPEYEFKEVSSASRSRRRRERQERREGRLRRFKDKLALVFHHRHDHHHHHHIAGGRSDGPLSRHGKESKSPWSYLGGTFHRSSGQNGKQKSTSRMVVPVQAKRRSGGQAQSMFGALVKHKLGARKAPARAPMVCAGSLSRARVKKMHWWQQLRRRHGRAEGSNRPRRRLGQGKAL